jgi:hypothetical protein
MQATFDETSHPRMGILAHLAGFISTCSALDVQSNFHLRGQRALDSASLGVMNISKAEAGASRAKARHVNIRFINLSSIIFAILQSACTAVIAISGVRVAIGLSALAAAAGIHAPAHGFHQNAIRIPMMVLAFLGASVNLYVVWKVRRLRSRPASQWRQQPVAKKKLNSERFQIALSVLTLLLLAAEWITHPMVHRVP